MRHGTKSFLSILTTVLLVASIVTVWRSAYVHRPVVPEGTVPVGQLLVPMTVELDGIHLDDPGVVRVVGDVSLRYDANLREALADSALGLDFPDALESSRGIQSSEEVWRDEDGVDLTGEQLSAIDSPESLTQVVTWAFDLDFPISKDRSAYPFDRIETLRLKHTGSSRIVGLDPAPVVIADGASVPAAWTPMDGYLAASTQPDLPSDVDFVVPLRRAATSFALRDLFPLAVVFGLLYVLARSLTGRDSTSGSSPASTGIAVACGSMFLLAVGLSHALLRFEIDAVGIVFAESFHAVAYLTILGVAVAVASGGRSHTQLRLFFWPLICGAILTASLYYLPGWYVPATSVLVPLIIASIVSFIALLFLGRESSGGTGTLQPVSLGVLHSLSAGGDPRCGASSDFVTSDRERVTCRTCHRLLYEASREPVPLDTWRE